MKKMNTDYREIDPLKNLLPGLKGEFQLSVESKPGLAWFNFFSNEDEGNSFVYLVENDLGCNILRCSTECPRLSSITYSLCKTKIDLGSKGTRGKFSTFETSF